MLLIWPPWTRKYLHHWLEHEVERETCDIAVANYIQVQEVTCISWYWGLSAGWWGSGRGISSTASLCRPGHGTDEAVCRYTDMAAHLYVGCVESERGRDHLGDVPLQQRREALRPGHLPEPGQVVAWRKDLLPRHASDVWRYLHYLYLEKVPIMPSPLSLYKLFPPKIGTLYPWNLQQMDIWFPKILKLKPCFQRNLWTSNFRWRQLVSRHSPTDNIAVRIT